MPSSFRPGVAIAAALLINSVAFAFSAPLSDEAVREAYFLGQRKNPCGKQTIGLLQRRHARIDEIKYIAKNQIT